jgi:hypothetical protein
MCATDISPATIAAAIRRYLVAGSPAAIAESIGFIVGRSNAAIAVSISATAYDAAEGHEYQCPGH